MGRAHDRYERTAVEAPLFTEREQRMYQDVFALRMLIHTLYAPKEPGTVAHILWIENHHATLMALLDLTNPKRRWPRNVVDSVQAFIDKQKRNLMAQADAVDDEAMERARRIQRSVVRPA